MSMKKSSMQQSEDSASLRRSGRVRRNVVVCTYDSDSSDIEEKVPRKHPIGRCSGQKQKCLAVEQEQHLQEPALVTNGHEMPPGETRDGVPEVELPFLLKQEKPMGHEMPLLETREVVPALELPSLPEQEKPMDQETLLGETRDGLPAVVELPSSPEEEKPKCDLLFLLQPAMEPQDRQCLLDSASVFKSKLVDHFKRSAGNNLSTSNMKILASECYSVLEKLGDDYTSFHSEVRKLIAQQEKVESAAKGKENWNEWQMETRYIDQLQSLYKVREKLSIAEQNLSRAKTEVKFLMFKKEEMNNVLRTLTEKLYEEEQKLKSLTQERDELQKTQSDIEVGLVQLAAKKEAASVAFEAYDAAKEEFERMSKHLLQLLRKN